MHYKAAWACGQAALRLAHMPTRRYDHHRLSPLVSTRNDEGPVFQASDLVNAMAHLWCGGDLPIVEKVRRLGARFPAQRGLAQRLRAQASEALTFWSDPYSFYVSVHASQRKVSISTSREGGGDVFDWAWRSGRWRLIRFEFGGAC